MDGLGWRQSVFDIAARLASRGLFAIVPNLYYRWEPLRPFDPQNVFAGGAERERLMSVFGKLTADFISADVAAIISFLEKDPRVQPRFGCTGYCMGGRYSLTMAGLSPKVAAAASFHGGNLANESPDSAHLLAAKSSARLYIAVAGIDAFFTAEEEGRLAKDLRAAATDHLIETYKGAHHGLALVDNPVYSQWAMDRHWKRLDELYGETLLG
jgi:carboxymethylenebutenolidase